MCDDIKKRLDAVEVKMKDLIDRMMRMKQMHDDDCPYVDKQEQCTCWIKEAFDRAYEGYDKER